MMERKLTVAEIILIAGTRVALGAGIGLLLSTRLNNDQRKAAGLALALVGGLTTIPLALGVIGKRATTTETGQRRSPDSTRWANRSTTIVEKIGRSSRRTSYPLVALGAGCYGLGGVQPCCRAWTMKRFGADPT